MTATRFPKQTVLSRSLGLGLAAAASCGWLVSPAWAQQGNLDHVQRQGQQLDVVRGGGDLRTGQDDSVRASRSVQQSLRQRAEQNRRESGQLRQREQQAVLRRSTQEASATTTAGGAVVSDGVDERGLWKLLQQKNLVAFDRQLASLRQQHGEWKPSAGLLQERQRLQSDADIDRALAQAANGQGVALDDLQAVVARYPAQFSCERIDRLWSAAELLAKGGRRDAALALYRSVFPACTPPANRIATLYMAQQTLGADSEAVARLIELESAGQRDDESQARFARLVYDRELTRLAALAPASEQALQLAAPLSEPVRGYLDAPAATLIGWIMLAHNDLAEAAVWFNRARQWQPANVDAQLGLLQIALEAGNVAGADALLAQPALAADPRARAQRARLQLLRADQLNRDKNYSASLAALDDAMRLGASAGQTAQLRAWNLYGSGRYEQAAQIFASQYRSDGDARMAEGWALAESARGRLDILAADPEASQAPLADYVMALQAQQLYYRKQFIEARSLQRRIESDIAAQEIKDNVAALQLRESVTAYQPAADLKGVGAASVTAGLSYSNHAGADGQGHLETLSPALRAEWFGGANGTRVYNLRWRALQLDAGRITPEQTAQALGVPASATQSGKPTVQDLWFSVEDSLWLTSLGRLSWQAAVGATTGGTASSALHGMASVGQQTAWGSWSTYVGSNPVRDSLLSWRGTALGTTGDWWGAVRRNAIGARTLVQVSPRWSTSANVELATFSGYNVQSNRAAVLDLGAGYDLKLADFDYFNVGPALHYLHYDNNQNQYGWGLGGYYSPQRSVSLGLASQFLTLEGRQTQLTGNLELGINRSSESASSCLPVSTRSVAAGAINCGYAGSSNSGMYAHVQLAAVKRLSSRWQLGVLGDLNVTPGRDRQYAAMLFVRYFFEDRAAVFSRDLPKNTRDFSGQLDDGR
ncbi:cellulose synthase subunit BcsC-related outer membrane protein [Herbaspirillum sp. alder98]|uniref:cellulose synthase subunit BcsC-related outer membrane protein n=1 Tax=Herbaspirillum sp. alder98 TaxID=2913096 RepID=UPI001CD84249|nr:cellulose synthase subunit BcsC-related outer membrane protein [Herbaspirillum sp. alder98]MCA1323396.1 BCSC C-terminal domain-containing protein [Herbaspirillum sp. alder98]